MARRPRPRKRCKRSRVMKKVREQKREENVMSSQVPIATNNIEDTSQTIFNRLMEESRKDRMDKTPKTSQCDSSLEMDLDTSASDSDVSSCEMADLIVEHVPIEQLEESNVVSGRRLVDINHLLKQLETVANHGKHCTMGKYRLNREIGNGLYSKFVYHCDNCDKEYTVTSDPEEKKNEANDGLVWGSMSIGIGHSQVTELFSILDVPTMSAKKFRNHENSIGNIWEEEMIKKMKQNADEEKKIAVEKGNYMNGVPYITVIGDGGWAKRSYGHGMNSSSGVGIVIGAATQKILFLGVRNKFCYVCTKSKAAKQDVPDHDCFINYSGPSTGMESDVIVEAFRQSESEYGLIYKYYIGDGDSSVFARIQEKCRYGRFVTKVECANHMTRCFSDSLHKLASNTTFPLESRRLLTSCREGTTISRLERLVKGVRAAIKTAGPSKNLEDIKYLRQDLKNAPNHVFGDHAVCRETFCKLKSSDEENVLEKLDPKFLTEIRRLIDKLDRKADTLALNQTTNAAERYMGLVSKFIGGKRINFTARGSYKRRCYAAGLSHTKGPSWHLSPWKKMQGRSPGHLFKRRFAVREQMRAKRKLNFLKETSKRKRTSTRFGHDKDYGPNTTEPDVPEDELKTRMDNVLQDLQQDVDIREQLEQDTIGQHDNDLWIDKRKNRITASKFGHIVKRLDTTSCHNLVKSLLFPKNLNSAAVVFGRLHEKEAIKKYEESQGVIVRDCGFFIDPFNSFLGASPDGLVSDDGLVEVKCLPSVSTPLHEYMKEKKKVNICLEINKAGDVSLKKSHQYYFQIQGQLNITQRKWCDLVVFTATKELFVQRVLIDKELWLENMLPKLKRFYMECLLPEIADSRIVREMRVREPDFILKAQERQKIKQEERNKVDMQN